MRTFLKILTAIALLCGTGAAAQGISAIQNSDGTGGTVIDLGGGFRSYSDLHGTRGTITGLGGGLHTYRFPSPYGGLQSGTILTFPTPRANSTMPPAGLMPAPVLPFTPKGPPMPREQKAPAAPNAGTFHAFGNSGTGRLGGR